MVNFTRLSSKGVLGPTLFLMSTCTVLSKVKETAGVDIKQFEPIKTNIATVEQLIWIVSYHHHKTK